MKLDRSLVTIFTLVVALHAGLILWAFREGADSPIPTPLPPLVVKTIALQPPKLNNSSALKPAPKKTTPPPKPIEKKPIASKPIPKKAPAKQKETTPPPPEKKDDPLLNAARDALRNLKQPTTVEPTKTLAQTEPSTHSTNTLSYEQDLSQRLHKFLRLPEYGQVTIQLTLNRTGTVDKVNVLEAESQTNRDYIQKQLPNLRFVGFGKHYSGEEKHSFMLVLKNE